VTFGQFDDFLAGLEDAPGAFDDLLARRGERDPLGRAFDQLDAQVALELLELRGERRLADETALGGTAEVARVGHGDEVTQVLEFEVGHRCSLWSLSNQSIGRNGVCPGEYAPR
jgi:hypothetical protein